MPGPVWKPLRLSASLTPGSHKPRPSRSSRQGSLERCVVLLRGGFWPLSMKKVTVAPFKIGSQPKAEANVRADKLCSKGTFPRGGV